MTYSYLAALRPWSLLISLCRGAPACAPLWRVETNLDFDGRCDRGGHTGPPLRSFKFGDSRGRFSTRQEVAALPHMRPQSRNHGSTYVTFSCTLLSAAQELEPPAEDNLRAVRRAPLHPSRCKHFTRSIVPLRTGVQRSPVLSRRLRIVRMVNCDGSSPRFTSSHRSGVETVAPGCGRTE